MENRRELGIKERKGLYAERWWVKSRNNPVMLWCASS